MLTYSLSAACGRYSRCSLVSVTMPVRDGFDSVALLIFCTPQKASVGMYSRCLSLTNLVRVLFDPAIPTSSFNFIVFLYLFQFFFIALSIMPSYMVCSFNSQPLSSVIK